MHILSHLWLPIIVATVVMFVLSALMWTAMPHHKKEFRGVPDEDALLALLRKASLEPGNYTFPWCSPEHRSDKAKTDAWKQKWAQGPAGTLSIAPRGPMSMGKMMGQSIVLYLVVNFFLGAVGAHAIRFDTQPTFHHVFVVISLAAFMAYFFATVPECIWFGKPWKSQALL